MVFYPRRSKKNKTKTRKASSKSRGVKLSRGMKVAIKKAIHDQAENKRMDFNGNVFGTNYGGNNWNSNQVIPMSPYNLYLNNVQGITQGTRIGNKISTRALYFSGIIYPAGYNASSNPIPCPTEIRFIWVKSKDTPTALLQSGGAMNNFFQYGGSTAAPNGSLSDIFRPVNKDLFTVMGEKCFKLGNANYAGSNADANRQYWANNDFKYNHKFRFNLTKWCPKVVTFNDNTSIPSSPMLQCLIFASYANNENYGPANANTFFKIDYSLEYQYEDS